MQQSQSLLWTGVALAFCSTSPAAGQEPSETPACRHEVLEGRISFGQDYEAALSPEIVFRLDAATHARNPAGWTLRITPPSMPDSDYSMVATPPYRFANPR